ncbi:SWIM zinc finger family protein [Paenibacillus sp. PAMC21692]|uniref:SWIM zinc finger family protein n=1 Tax=Paenibacillus sp. PAMC21692 TaxID=2762320 RepID=UPI00164CE012|nr:SWIM zinc finger family protein [Paenibacillus sp. PAMC21692]QNK58125.1 SWIM zinc finger family protein [Paenibacillus sp. PAMC21692]
MIALTEAFVDSLAPNLAAAKNGRDLVKKNKLSNLRRSADGVLLFGDCAGSGSSGYQCSADFVVADKPVFRCNCPSRQFPCKHGLGLLYAYTGGREFAEAEVPAELEAKREKAEQRQVQKAKAEAEGASGEAAKPRKVNKSALAKKIAAQLEGLDLLEKLVNALIRSGLATVDKKGIKHIREQVTALGNHYLPGAQTELRKLALLLEEAEGREASFGEAVEQLALIHALIRKGRPYLAAKQADPDLKPDAESAIEEWLGHAWQLAELQEHGLVQTGTELIQLSFISYDDAARQEFVDAGYWLELESGAIHRTMNYRPYKAAKHMKEEDSFFEVATVGQLYVYPGTVNRRVRFDGVTSAPALESHLAKARETAEPLLSDAVKRVKNELKNPLGNKQPVLLAAVESLRETENGEIVIADRSGGMLQLGDVPKYGRRTTELLRLLSKEKMEGAAMLLLFAHLPESGRLIAQPLSIIHDAGIIRLWY